MKNTLFIALVALSTSVFAQESPRFLDGFNYKVVNLTSEDGEEFIAYECRVQNNKSFRKLNKRFKNLNHCSTWVEKGIVFTERENNCYTVVRGWAWGFRTFGVYYN